MAKCWRGHRRDGEKARQKAIKSTQAKRRSPRGGAQRPRSEACSSTSRRRPQDAREQRADWLANQRAGACTGPRVRGPDSPRLLTGVWESCP